MKKVLISLVLIFLTMMVTGSEFNFDSVKERVSEFTLSNGLKFILLEDHSVPIASFVTYANAGGSDERIGIYGISHILEHLAFKGTSEVGTKNYKKEIKILNKMDSLFEVIRNEKNSFDPDNKKIAELEKNSKHSGMKPRNMLYLMNLILFSRKMVVLD